MSDPLTQEHVDNQESLLELEQRVLTEQAKDREVATDELSIMDLESKLLDAEANAPTALPYDPEVEDGFFNNTWEVTGSAVEKATEQVVRTLGDVTSFAEGVGPQISVGSSEFIDPEGEGEGVPIPFTDIRVDINSSERARELAVNYEIATGKQVGNISRFELPDVDRPDSAAGQMTSAFLQWGVVFAATRKAGMGNISGAVVADFAAFDPHEARLADLAATMGEGNPVFDNAFTQYMSADPTDHAVEGRLKNALEGLVIGGAIEGVMASFRWFRGYRAAKAARVERNMVDREALTPEGPELKVELDDNITNIKSEVGKLEAVERGGETLQVVESLVDDAAQGQGHGKALYDAAVEQAEERGLRLVSDTEVSEQATYIWESMARRGDEIIDQRVTNPENVVKELDAGSGTYRYNTKNGTPLFERVGRQADEVGDQARRTIGGDKVAETFHDVALRQLKASLKADPAKLRAIRTAMESGDTHAANELLDFNHAAVDWDGLAKQLGDGESVDEFVKIINSFSDVFATEMKSAKGYQSMTETLARSVGATADDVLKLGRDVKGSNGLAARMAGADTMLYQSTQELRRLAKLARETGGDADMMNFFRQVDLHATLQATIKGSKAEIARALHQMRRVSTAHIDDFKEFDDLMRDATGLGGDQRRHLAQKIADLKDMNKINQSVRKSKWRTRLDYVTEVYINGLLSGISTLMLNNVSNTLKVIEGVTERYFAAGLGAIRAGGRKALGREAIDRVTFREANAYLYGTMTGLDAALRIPFGKLLKEGPQAVRAEDFGSVYRAFVDEKPVLDTRMRVDADTRKAIAMTDESDLSIYQAVRQLELGQVDWNAKAVNSLGKLIRIPGRLIMTSDELFKQITYNQHLASRAYKDGDAIARAKGKTGKQRQAIIERTHRNYQEFPPEDVRFESMDHARYQTFQQDLPNGIARDFESFINRNPIMRFVVPFYRTPVNIVKQTVIERTPLPFIKAHKSEILQRIVKGGPEGDIALARMATGSAFIGWGMNMAMNGTITGGALSTNTTANSEALDDIPPYSVKIGKTWYQYNRLEPLGMLLGLSADLATAAEWYQDDDDTEFVEAASLAVVVITSNVTDKTWFKGVAEVVAAIEDPKRYGPNFTKKFTGTLVTPYSSLLRRINVDHDPIAREAWTWMDNWKANVPGFSDELPISYDLLGQPRKKRDYLGPSWASPVAQGVERDDPVYQEIARLAFEYRKPNKDLFGVGENVTAEVYSDVMRRKGETVVRGHTLHEKLESLMESGFYEDLLSDEGKADAVKGVISGYLNAAKREFLNDNPDYFDDVKLQKEAALNLKLQP